MRKNFVLDTSVLLYDPQAVFQFDGNNIMIPIEVVEEIDEFKHDVSERGRNSRTVAGILDGLRGRGRLGEGVRLEHGGLLRVICDQGDERLPWSEHVSGNWVSNRVLCVALSLQDRAPDEATIVVTKNVNLRVKANALGIPAQDYDVDRFPDATLESGWRIVNVDAEIVALLARRQSVRPPGFSGYVNEFILARALDAVDTPAQAGRVTENGLEIEPLSPAPASLVGIRPLNLEQAFVVDALLNDKLNLVILTGKAGTGKTLLAVAAGLHKVFAEDRYNRLLVFRPTLPLSRDIGYLPGDVQEKMRPWMQPVYDALELLREEDKRSAERILPPDVMECEEISIEPLTYIRGRSIPHQFIIIDEAQNLTPLEVKTVITRVGRGTKIVLTGDPQQIDNPYVDACSNGLTFLVDKFRANALAAHVCLAKGERSALAETAADLL